MSKASATNWLRAASDRHRAPRAGFSRTWRSFAQLAQPRPGPLTILSPSMAARTSLLASDMTSRPDSFSSKSVAANGVSAQTFSFALTGGELRPHGERAPRAFELVVPAV